MLFSQWITSTKVLIWRKNFDLQKSCQAKYWDHGIRFRLTLLKVASILSSTSVTQLCNLFISSWIFPDSREIVKLVPLFKKDSKTNSNRSHELPPNIAFTACIKSLGGSTSWTNYGIFWQTKKIVHKKFSGFRKNHSTDFSLSFLTDKISNGFDSRLNNFNPLSKSIWYDRSWYFNTKKCLRLDSLTKWLISLAHFYPVENLL